MTIETQEPPRRTLLEVLYCLYEQSQFSMAGAVAFSFVVSLFPFCIFIGALSGVLGGRELADGAVDLLFQVFPDGVAAGLAPEVRATMSGDHTGLLTLSAGFALFFATSAIESLRAALNGAYRVSETRSYVLCLAISFVFVFASALTMLVMAWAVIVGPAVAARFEPAFLDTVLSSTWGATIIRYTIAAVVIALELFAFHIWLAAGRRTLRDVWPGVALSVVLWLAMAGLYSFYLDFSDYTKFYAGLSQLMIALIYFQFTAIIIILGAEVNREMLEFKRMR